MFQLDSRWTTKHQVVNKRERIGIDDKLDYFLFIGTRKLFLKPASFASAKNEQNGSSTENGSTSSPSVNNPFLKCEKEEPEGTKNEEKSDEHEKDPAAKQTTNNLFKPTKTNLFANAAGSTLSDNSNFVFGQNLHERVVMVIIEQIYVAQKTFMLEFLF